MEPTLRFFRIIGIFSLYFPYVIYEGSLEDKRDLQLCKAKPLWRQSVNKTCLLTKLNRCTRNSGILILGYARTQACYYSGARRTRAYSYSGMRGLRRVITQVHAEIGHVHTRVCAGPRRFITQVCAELGHTHTRACADSGVLLLRCTQKSGMFILGTRTVATTTELALHPKTLKFYISKHKKRSPMSANIRLRFMYKALTRSDKPQSGPC